MVACALYIAGRPGTDTTGGSVIQGNGVSLSQLLRASNIRYLSFTDLKCVELTLAKVSRFLRPFEKFYSGPAIGTDV